jgi:hypothetical protein
MFTWEDIQSFCDDLSAWIIETNTQEELEKACPKATFPLKANIEKDDIQDDLDALVYLTVWVCLKINSKAPPHLESRIIFAPKLKGPWKYLYSKLCNKIDKIDNKENIDDIWNLAG